MFAFGFVSKKKESLPSYFASISGPSMINFGLFHYILLLLSDIIPNR